MILRHTAALRQAIQHQSAVTMKTFLRENPAVVRNFVKSSIEAVHRLRAIRAVGMKIAVKYLRLADAELLTKT